MLFGTHGSTRMTIDSGGTTKLQRSSYSTSAATVSNAALYLDIGSTEGAVNMNQLIGFGYRNALTNAKPAYIGYKATDWSSHTKGDLIFGTRNSTGATDEATERLRIKSDGKVGIATDEPFSNLTVYAENRSGGGTATGQIAAKDNAAWNASPTGGIIFMGQYHSNGAQAIFGGVTGFKESTNVEANYAGALAFHTRKDGEVSGERLRITSAGNVLSLIHI